MSRPRTLTGALLVVTAMLLAAAGCGRVERVPAPYGSRSAPPGAASASPDDEAWPGTGTDPGDGPSPGADPSAGPDDPAAGLPGSGYPTPTPGATAVPCAGQPGVDQVIAALRRNGGVRPPGTTPRVVTAPVCAGSWQYTVLDFPGQGMLQVVTRGGDPLTVVTAGTFVCTPEVKGAAPAGIVAAAHCQ
ncbi:hypothetical protein ACNTMW_11330 [Planosporangium sp. 12N6]|uniref:hypothetical protein n=1 Tax=Planosporangium spinosum TaxID=3402278 RepID=UPI003CE930B2